MIIHAYGLFWRADEINWNPGNGKRDAFRLLGRIGSNSPNIQMADFRSQRGIYILYGNYGPHYVGLTRKQNLGKRLKDHLSDEHRGLWDRFSWFGFCKVQKGKDKNGLRKLGDMPKIRTINPHDVIKDLEALLIKAMALKNKADMNFADAEEWMQVQRDQEDKFCGKII